MAWIVAPQDINCTDALCLFVIVYLCVRERERDNTVNENVKQRWNGETAIFTFEQFRTIGCVYCGQA